MTKDQIINNVFRRRHIANRGYFAGIDKEIDDILEVRDLTNEEIKEFQKRKKDWRNHLSDEHREALENFKFKVEIKNTGQVKIADAVSYNKNLHKIIEQDNNN